MAYRINQEICAGCHICELSCPTSAISMQFSKYQIDPEKCIGCGTCARYCHNAAIYDQDAEPVKSIQHETIRLDCDILIIGAGASGLVAGAKAADAGKSVVVLEKNFEIGGSAYYGHMMRSHYSKWQEEAGFPDRRKETYEEFLRKTEGKCNNELALNLLNANVDLSNWLIDTGIMEKGFYHRANPIGLWDVKAECIEKYPFDHLRSDPSCGPGESGWVICNLLAEHIAAKGGRILLNTSAVRLLTDQAGAVAGVLAKDQGGELEICAAATLVCAGSYSHNRDIMLKMQPDFYGKEGDEPIHIYACSTCTGDGITMCEELGADIDYKNKRAAMFGPMHHPFSYGVLTLLRAGGVELQVNKYGELAPATGGMTEIGSIATMPGRIAWSITDQKSIDAAMEKGAAPGNADEARAFRHCGRDLIREIRDGSTLMAETLEDLAKKAGFQTDTFLATVEEYNEKVRTGTLPMFGGGPGGSGGPDVPVGPDKPDGPGNPNGEGPGGMPPMGPMTPPHELKDGPFYAVIMKGFQENAVGGMVIDPQCKVLRNGKPIQGLFACGDNTRGIMLSGDVGVSYIEGYLSAMTYAMTSGYLAAEVAVNELG